MPIILKNFVLKVVVIGVVCIVALSILSKNNVAFAVVEISDGTVEALYHLDGDSVDSSGNGANGSDTGMEYPDFGFLNGSARFNGNTYPNNNASISMSLSDLTDISVNFWVKASSSSSGSFGHFTTGHWSGTGAFVSEVNNDHGSAVDNKMNASIYNNSPDTESNDSYWSTTLVYDDSWHMITIVMDSVNDIYNLYIDGSLEVNPSMTDVVPVAFESEAYLGTWKVGTNYRGMNGYLDEVAIFNNVISTSTINNLWNGGLGDTICTSPGCSLATSTQNPIINVSNSHIKGFLLLLLLVLTFGYIILK